MSPRISISLLAAQSDQRLAKLAGERHERAFEALVHRYRRPLLRYCRRMALADGRAEDVLQQAFLQAWIALQRGVEVRDVRAWLYRIVHNTAVNAMRGAATVHGELTDAIEAEAMPAVESELDRRIAVRDALSDVAALPRMQQRAIFLTAVDGQSHDEAASVLGISEGALRGLLYRARATLRGAAAALVPPPLLEWALRSAETTGGSGGLAELSAGGGAAGLLLKAAVVAVSAGVVATGASVASNRHTTSPSNRHGSLGASAIVRTAERASTSITPSLDGSSRSPVATGRTGDRAERRRHEVARQRERADRDERRASNDDRSRSQSDDGDRDVQALDVADAGDDRSGDQGERADAGSGAATGRQSPGARGSKGGSGSSADGSGGGGHGASGSGRGSSGGSAGSSASATAAPAGTDDAVGSQDATAASPAEATLTSSGGKGSDDDAAIADDDSGDGSSGGDGAGGDSGR